MIEWLVLSGRSWAATTTEGLLVYSLDGSMVFDPYDLDLDVTPASIHKQLRLKEWVSAIILAFRLNEKALKQEVLETVPHGQSESTTKPNVHKMISLTNITIKLMFFCLCWFSSPFGLQFSSWHLCRKDAGIYRRVFREDKSSAVLHDVGPESAHAAWTEAQKQVSWHTHT